LCGEEVLVKESDSIPKSERPAQSGAERRATTRFDLAIPEVAFCALIRDEGDPLIARVIDVSSGGIRVVVPQRYEARWPSLKDGLFSLHINFGGHRVITAQVQVAWFGGVTKVGTTNLYSGLRFAEMQPADREWLEKFLQRLASSRASI